MTLTDEVLMSRVRDGDAQAFEQLYDRHSAAALRVARSYCADRERAADAVQDAYLAIWRGRGTWDPAGRSFKAWAMTIVRNRAVDVGRGASRRNRETELDEHLGETLPADGPSVDEEVGRRATLHVVRAEMGQLPPAQREALVLAYYGGLTQSEIARALHIPAGTVKGRMRLGLEKLRESMDAHVAAA